MNDQQNTFANGSPEFNERKATQMAAFFLARHDGSMKYIKLIKLMYLADRRALEVLNQPISTDQYVNMERGPVLSHTYNRIKGETEGSGEWAATICTQHDTYSVSLSQETETDEAYPLLSQSELQVLKEVYRIFGHLLPWQAGGLIEYCHSLPEYEDPAASGWKSKDLSLERIRSAIKEASTFPEQMIDIEGLDQEYLDDIKQGLADVEAGRVETYEEVFGYPLQ